MLQVLAFLINLFAPIVQPLGVLGVCGCVIYEDYQSLQQAGILAVAGVIFGILAHRLDIPPRWFWAKSRNEIFRYRIFAVLGYMWSLAAWPPAIYFVRLILGPVLANH